MTQRKMDTVFVLYNLSFCQISAGLKERQGGFARVMELQSHIYYVMVSHKFTWKSFLRRPRGDLISKTERLIPSF